MPANARRIPRPTAQRLSLYLRELPPLIAQGQTTIRSQVLGEKLGVTSAQVRKDLAWVAQSRQTGEVGRSGVGYNCLKLYEAIRRVVGTNRRWSIALVGVGNIGRALLGYGGFEQGGFPITVIFDSDDRMVGKRIGGRVVAPMSALRRMIRSRHIAIAIIAVPRSAAQTVANQLCDAEIKGILNFAPTRVSVAKGVSVTNIDMTVAFEQLSMDISIQESIAAEEDGA